MLKVLTATGLTVVIGLIMRVAWAKLLEARNRRRALDALTRTSARKAAARDEAEAADRARNGRRAMRSAPAAPPLAPAPAPEPEPAPVAEDAATRPLRILIAEDHPVNRKVLALILSAVDPEISFAETGVEAVNVFRPGAFDIVFMDMQMPVMDGLEATRALRRMEREAAARSTPVVMLTAHAMSEHAHASQEAGADCHLTKPVTAADVMAVLQEFCGPQAKTRPQAA